MPRVGGFLGRIFGSAVSGAAGTAAGTATAGALVPILQEEINQVWKRYQSRPLTAQEAAAAVERGEMTMAEATEEASLTGYGPGRFRVLERLAGLAPAPEQLLTMFRRGAIDADRLRRGLVQGNVRTEWADALIAIAHEIPSVSAMVRFGVREAYSGGSGMSGTTDELPGAFVADVKRHGLSASDAAHFWAAHWQLPSPTQGYAMLHRGLLTMGELVDLLRVADYPPFWRDKLASVAYHVPTRVDLRRMLEHGVIDEARVMRGYKDLGYTDEDAATLTAFAVELAKPEPKANPERVDWAQRALGMAFGDVHGWVKKGDMTEGQAAGALAAIGIPEKAAGAAAGYWASVLAAHG